jgi:hypothetical protein
VVVIVFSCEGHLRLIRFMTSGTLPQRYQVSRHASYETFQGHGATVWRREDHGGLGLAFRHSYLPTVTLLRFGRGGCCP